MPLKTVGELSYYYFDIFPPARVGHGIFTRQGGISPQPWRSLNLGGTVGDEKEHVVENRRRMFGTLHRKVESLFDVWQVHSADVICTEDPRPLTEKPSKS